MIRMHQFHTVSTHCGKSLARMDYTRRLKGEKTYRSGEEADGGGRKSLGETLREGDIRKRGKEGRKKEESSRVSERKVLENCRKEEVGRQGK